VGLLAGCERAAVKQSYPPDPLFLSKKPVEGKVESARPVLAYHEPVVPPLPAGALASAPRERLALPEGRTVTAAPPSTPEKTVTGGSPGATAVLPATHAIETGGPRLVPVE
jgi:hypothetical protein